MKGPTKSQKPPTNDKAPAAKKTKMSVAAIERANVQRALLESMRPAAHGRARQTSRISKGGKAPRSNAADQPTTSRAQLNLTDDGVESDPDYEDDTYNNVEDSIMSLMDMTGVLDDSEVDDLSDEEDEADTTKSHVSCGADDGEA